MVDQTIFNQKKTNLVNEMAIWFHPRDHMDIRMMNIMKYFTN